MFCHQKTNQRNFEYTSIKVSVKKTDANDLYMECIHVATIAEQIKEQQRMKKASSFCVFVDVISVLVLGSVAVLFRYFFSALYS